MSMYSRNIGVWMNMAWDYYEWKRLHQDDLSHLTFGPSLNFCTYHEGEQPRLRQTCTVLSESSLLANKIWNKTKAHIKLLAPQSIFGHACLTITCRLFFHANVVICWLFSKFFFFSKNCFRNTISVVSVLIWVQTVCKCYQQTTKVK